MYCGARLQALVPCAKCNRPLEPSATKCVMCGTPTGSRQAAQPSASSLAAARVEMFQAAERARASEHLQDAITLYRGVLDADPQHAHAWVGYAKTLMLLGHRAEAVEALDRALAAKPDLDEAKRLRATFAAAAAASPPPYRRPGERTPDASLPDLLRRVITCLDERRFEQALGLLDQVLAESPPALLAHPDVAAIHAARARALTGLRRFAEAVAEAERALARNAGYAPAWAAKADAEDELGLAAAVDSFDRAAALDPSVPSVWVDRGYVLRKRGRLDDALASYDRALALDRRLPIAWNNKGNVLVELERWAEAAEAYDHALALDPKLDGARGMLQKLVNEGRVAREKVVALGAPGLASGGAWTAVAEGYARSHAEMFAFPLDFSPASVLALDYLLDLLVDVPEVPPADDWAPNETQRGIVTGIGAYLGEVFRRVSAGVWMNGKNANPAPFSSGVFVARPAAEIGMLPFMRVHKRFKYGVDRLYAYYADLCRQCDVARPEGADPAPWVTYGRILAGNRLLEEAAGAFDIALAIDPRHADARAERARMDAELGRAPPSKLPPGLPGPSMMELLASGGPAEAFAMSCVRALAPGETAEAMSFMVDVPLAQAKKWRASALSNMGVRADVIASTRAVYTSAYEGAKLAVDLDPVVIRAWAAIVDSGRVPSVTFVGNVGFGPATERAIADANAKLLGGRLRTRVLAAVK